MDNLLGRAIEAWPELLAEPGARLHLYGKREIRAGRKLGHVTRLTRPGLSRDRPFDGRGMRGRRIPACVRPRLCPHSEQGR